MLGLWPAAALVLITIALIYITLFQILKLLFRKHFMWFVASIIFLSPFGLVLSQARNLLELMWILLLTPFYGVLVLCLATVWIIRFYCLAFAILLIVQFLLQSRKDKNKPKSWDNFEVLFTHHLKENIYSAARVETMVNRVVRKGRILAEDLWKCWSIVLAVILLVTLASTFVSSATLTNPTYLEAQQFVSKDKTDSHPYLEGSYTCANFASDFRRNAQGAGYECGYVYIYFPNEQSHVLNCFNTTDKGLIYVEPQWDKFVNVTVGKPYFNYSTVSLVYNYTVLWFYIDWQKSSMVP
jgi:hypothetical protein